MTTITIEHPEISLPARFVSIHELIEYVESQEDEALLVAIRETDHSDAVDEWEVQALIDLKLWR
jgi:hypothetical protein